MEFHLCVYLYDCLIVVYFDVSFYGVVQIEVNDWILNVYLWFVFFIFILIFIIIFIF